MPINIIEMHERLTKHLLAPFSSGDERYLALCLCGEAGELANFIKKRWRGDRKEYIEEIRDEIADVRVYLELLAKRLGIEGDKLDQRVQTKLTMVAMKRRAEMRDDPEPPRAA